MGVDDWNNEAETADQSRIDDYDRDRLLSLSESIAHEIAMDVARKFGVMVARNRADELEALAASDIYSQSLRNLYLSIASVYREGAWQVERTRRAS